MSATERSFAGTPVLVIGIGNRYRSDDAAGLAVAERIRSADLEGVDVIEVEGDTTSLIDAWGDSPVVYLLDAVSSGGRPGSVYRFDAATEQPPPPFRHRGTHAFSVADVVELARVLDRLPRRLVVYGIEGKGFAAGVGLSPDVERASTGAADRVLSELQAGDR
jgi:hydrogenase maturation protease